MLQQKIEGHSVAMMWPGQLCIINKRTKIKDLGDILLGNETVKSFEIINPLPVSLDEGIADITAYTTDVGGEAYGELLDTFKPDVIHVHTLMGLHNSFLKASRDRKIRLVFTAHDFFPVCPKVTMYRKGKICSCVDSCEKCGVCNVTALSLKKIQLLQSSLYRILKDSFFVKKIRKRHRDGYLSDVASDETVKPVGKPEDYQKLREYYFGLLKQMDVIHYNSNVTKTVYESVFDLPNNHIVSITHSDIKDRRIIKKFSDNMLRIRYLGPMGGAKGFFLLKAALDELWSEQQNFCLDVHFTPTELSPYMNVHNRYSYKDLGDIFEKTDVLVAPSILYETFGYTVLEALSYGVPVIISGTVGAKDILTKGAGIIVENITPEKLCSVFRSLTIGKLRAMNAAIVEKQPIMQIEDMTKQLEQICYGWN
ncbi:glycosyltransferase [Faecalicoccus pleomorphus]|nr:glycosyltransferase [Faecalicoccus pleomorphus]